MNEVALRLCHHPQITMESFHMKIIICYGKSILRWYEI